MVFHLRDTERSTTVRKKFIPNDNNKAVCYYRYSSTAQNEASIEQQREAARKYAAEHGYHIIHEYEDPHQTGTNDNRPQFKKMLQDIQNSRPAVLIMWKTDRLARDDDVFYTSKAALREAGVRREYVADINTDDTHGLLVSGRESVEIIDAVSS